MTGIGSLRHRLTIQTAVTVSDDGGGQTVTWTKLVTIWGRIKSLRGSEQLRAMQLEGKITHRIITRYRGDITTAHRILFRSRTFNIRTVIDEVDERQRYSVILAEEGVAT